MKKSFALLTLFAASQASAAPSETDAQAVVEKQLVAPLKAKESRQKRFSRAYQPPQVRRVRVLDSEAVTDGDGAAFMTFAVDTQNGLLEDVDGTRPWRTDVIVGCVYPESGKVFIKRGETYFGAGLLLGKKTNAAGEHVCHGAATQVAVAK